MRKILIRYRLASKVHLVPEASHLPYPDKPIHSCLILDDLFQTCPSRFPSASQRIGACQDLPSAQFPHPPSSPSRTETLKNWNHDCDTGQPIPRDRFFLQPRHGRHEVSSSNSLPVANPLYFLHPLHPFWLNKNKSQKEFCNGWSHHLLSCPNEKQKKSWNFAKFD